MIGLQRSETTFLGGGEGLGSYFQVCASYSSFAIRVNLVHP